MASKHLNHLNRVKQNRHDLQIYPHASMNFKITFMENSMGLSSMSQSRPAARYRYSRTEAQPFVLTHVHWRGVWVRSAHVTLRMYYYQSKSGRLTLSHAYFFAVLTLLHYVSMFYVLCRAKGII